MTYFSLKVIACLTMLIDHYGVSHAFTFDLLDTLFLSPIPVNLLRLIGRISFPLFAFLIANGFSHTKNQSRYALRLLILAVCSEIPFNLFLAGEVIHFGTANVVFTLLIGYLCLWFRSMLREHARYPTLLCVAVVTIGCICALCLGSDYSFIGVLAVYVFGVFDVKTAKGKVCLVVSLAFLMSYRTAAPYLAEGINAWLGGEIRTLPVIGGLFFGDMWPLFVRLFSLVSLLPIFFYKGEKGKIFERKGWRRFLTAAFYGFYPVHMLVLYLIR